MPQGLPLFKPPYSRLTAIDMNRGEHAWMVPAGEGQRIRALPQLKGLDLPPLGGDSTYSGPLATKTLLVYALTTVGRLAAPAWWHSTSPRVEKWRRWICPGWPSARR